MDKYDEELMGEKKKSFKLGKILNSNDFKIHINII